MSLTAAATPSKRFFIDMLTRDITLEDAILDLMDNSIDSLTRKWQFESAKSILTKLVSPSNGKGNLPLITIDINKDGFEISDKCGGIDIEDAKREVFRFGHTDENKRAFLSVYGIGLKRALFKLGKDITIHSQTTNNGFEVKFNVDDWKAREAWDFPLEEKKKASKEENSGTTINVKTLNKEVLERLHAGTLLKRLQDRMEASYTYFLEKDVRVKLNKEVVTPFAIPIGHSGSIEPSFEEFETDEVTVQLIAGLASRKDGDWQAKNAGWYILCNGRMVTVADKTEISGWGRGVASFVPKYRGFIGIAFFTSKNPEKLPWRTTKRDLNVDAVVYQQALNRMITTAKPVINLLNNMYSSEENEKGDYKKLADEVTGTDIKQIVDKGSSTFSFTKPAHEIKKTTVRVQYEAKIDDVEKVKKCIGKSKWSAGKVGEHTFKYFMEQECPE